MDRKFRSNATLRIRWMKSTAGAQTRRVVIAVAIFILMMLSILYSASTSDSQAPYAPFDMAQNHTPRPTNLKTWATKDDYVPVLGEEVRPTAVLPFQPAAILFFQRMTQHCQHCALVSSSSHVLGTKAGEQIDATECVIRMNDAPTTGYEADVGKRTTLRVVGHSSVYRLVSRPDEFMVGGVDYQRIIVFWGPPSKITKDSKATMYTSIQKICSTYKRALCFTLAPEKMSRFDKLFEWETGRDRFKSNSWLTTGWFTMVIAIEICDNIKVYGMVPPSYCGNRTRSKMLYHYYKPRGSDECVKFMQSQNIQRGNYHRFITEKQVFARWAQHYNITFAHPKW
ncbi:alpha-N-acetylgalactosaminide alpha-2,6-sialyltransferase 6-like isoform X2 [Syngnathus acus]|uniref:alpha-N-acetylgalactosaminide alpha-2,6-sialyltransferase 6-like isoform X2 n=1 Tax=Syngnathus acus TaxID=161584 RepID=UPI00188607FF|nr:alpha-N-acetylgalactosaminide alpha-2,6-sialyltransferase 6-like isoform X2 [Syngnathus acus]